MKRPLPDNNVTPPKSFASRELRRRASNTVNHEYLGGSKYGPELMNWVLRMEHTLTFLREDEGISTYEFTVKVNECTYTECTRNQLVSQN